MGDSTCVGEFSYSIFSILKEKIREDITARYSFRLCLDDIRNSRVASTPEQFPKTNICLETKLRRVLHHTTEYVGEYSTNLP